MKSKYTIGSKIHQALCKIENTTMDAGTWRKSIQYKDAPSIFDRAIIQPLVNDGMVNRVDYNFYITTQGSARLDTMGRYVKKPVVNKRLPVSIEIYRGNELTQPATRQGADDHFSFPSKRGNTLYYRDGSEIRL